MLYTFFLPSGFHLQVCQMAFTYENERSHEIMTYVFENIHILLFIWGETGKSMQGH